MPPSKAKFYCPLCNLPNPKPCQSYTIPELRHHFSIDHHHPEGSQFKTTCRRCVERQMKGDKRIRIKETTLEYLLRHLQIKKCFQFVYQNFVESSSELHSNTSDSSIEEPTENYNLSLESIDVPINEFNDNVDELTNLSSDNDEIIFSDNISDPHVKFLNAALKNFYWLMSKNSTTVEMLEWNITSCQQFALIYNNLMAVETLNHLSEIIKKGGLDKLKYISPFDENENISRELNSITSQSNTVPITENKKNFAVMIDTKYLLNLICQNHSDVISQCNNKIELQLYVDEININAFTSGMSQFLHVSIRLKNDFIDKPKLESIYTIALLPTIELKHPELKSDRGKYYNFFKAFLMNLILITQKKLP
uniref:C2H2-type domain-containing protein n=1 Tax=Strongyloides venezuelensis TaxID=75913 RepID=A0A0K0FB96_STRVS